MPPRVRPPAADDADAVLELILARDIADLGAPDFTLEDLRADWATPGLVLEHDARVAAAGRAIQGYAILLGEDAVVLVHPEAEGKGTGPCCARWAEARAVRARHRLLRQFAAGRNDTGRVHLREAGYEPVQHYFRLRADLADVPPPTGVDAAHVRTGRRGGRTRVDPGGVRGDRRARVPDARAVAGEGDRQGGPRPVAVLLARGRRRVAGAVLGERWEDGVGYVGELAVARRARGRGHGRALLLGCFEAFRRAGLRSPS